MAGEKVSLIVGPALIVVGSGWLLSTQGIMPQINWIWTLGLLLTGGLIFGLIGFDKVTVVAGSFFILTSVLSVLRQSGSISFDVEVPILVISSGVLVLIARLSKIPKPKWLIEEVAS